MAKPSPTRLLAGEIGKPHGIAGEVYVVPISDDPRRFLPGSTLSWQQRSLTIESSRQHGNRLLVKFEGVDTRGAAEAMRGPLFVPVEAARSLDDDEFWPHDLVGCDVKTPGGASVGTVKEVVPGAAHDLLVVTTDRGDRMVPLVKEIVRQIDLETAVILIDPPEGLLD